MIGPLTAPSACQAGFDRSVVGSGSTHVLQSGPMRLERVVRHDA